MCTTVKYGLSFLVFISFLHTNLVYAEPSYGGLIGRCFERPQDEGSQCVFGWLVRNVQERGHKKRAVEDSGHTIKAVQDSGPGKVELETTAGTPTKFTSELTPDAKDPNILYNYVDTMHNVDSSGSVIWNAAETGKDEGFKVWLLNLPGFGRKQVWCKIAKVSPAELANIDFKKAVNCLSYHYSPTRKTGNLYNPGLYDETDE